MNISTATTSMAIFLMLILFLLQTVRVRVLVTGKNIIVNHRLDQFDSKLMLPFDQEFFY